MKIKMILTALFNLDKFLNTMYRRGDRVEDLGHFSAGVGTVRALSPRFDGWYYIDFDSGSSYYVYALSLRPEKSEGCFEPKV